MDVTLVYPSLKNGWNSLGNGFDSTYINHGVASLAACLKQKGHTVRLLDLREKTGWASVLSDIKNDPAQVYGVSMSTLDYHTASVTAELIKTVKPKAKVIVGGPHPSICPDQVAQHKYFDHIVIGEGELTLPRLLNSETKERVLRGSRPNLNDLPFEDRTIFNMKKIFGAKTVFEQPFINVISGRGCVFRCGFCKPGEDMIFGKFRMRCLDHFMGEIRMLHDAYKFKTLMIDDDSFTLFPNYVLQFCSIYGREIKENFVCQSRADFIVKNPNIVKTLKDAGLIMFFIGFESGSQRMLDFMHKDTTVEQNFEAAEICRKNDIKIWANFMVGLPGETKEEMQATFNMIDKIKPEHPSGAFFTPIVGTDLYDYCKKHDLILNDDPAVLGSRNPGVPKIKGHDYGWMRDRMYKTNAPLWKRTVRPAYKVVRKVLKLVKPSNLKVDL